MERKIVVILSIVAMFIFAKYYIRTQQLIPFLITEGILYAVIFDYLNNPIDKQNKE